MSQFDVHKYTKYKLYSLRFLSTFVEIYEVNMKLTKDY